MGVHRRNAGYIGTDTYWVTDPVSQEYYGVWQPNDIVEYQKINSPGGSTPAWSAPGNIPSQNPISAFLFGPQEPAGAGPGQITIPTSTPHVYVFCAGGGGGGGVDHDNGQARSGGTGGRRFALFQRSQVANSGQTTMNYNVGNGGSGAPARSNDGNGGGGNNSSVNFGNFNINCNGAGGGCGKCQNNGSNGNTGSNGSVVFGGNGGQAPAYIRGSDAPALFSPVLNIPVNPEPVSFANPGSSNNGGGTGGSGGPGGLYVRFGRGINSQTSPGAGDDYGVPNPSYDVPDAAKLADL